MIASITPAVLLACTAWASSPLAQAQPTTHDVAGLWAAKRHFGPEARGPLTVERERGELRAEIAGRSAPVRVQGAGWQFELPGDEGAFRGEMRKDRIVGHWVQPRMTSNGMRFASPVTLERQLAGRWRGIVTPVDDELTFYLPILRAARIALRLPVVGGGLPVQGPHRHRILRRR